MLRPSQLRDLHLYAKIQDTKSKKFVWDFIKFNLLPFKTTERGFLENI